MGGDRGGKTGPPIGGGGKANGKSRRGEDRSWKRSGREGAEWSSYGGPDNRGQSDNGWGEYDDAHDGWGWQASREEVAATAPPKRASASQFRFADRILRRHAPEERVYDANQQLLPGDHIVAQQLWDCSERHGVVCSSASGSGARHYSYSDRQEPPWVIHWDGDHLQSSPLPKFTQGGELFRVAYPHWACRCLEPASSTCKPEILAEEWLEPAPAEAVVRFVNDAIRSNSWSPSWSTASSDLEFCLFAKLEGGGSSSSMPTWEIHTRRALSAKAGEGMAPGHPLGCLLRGDLRPSQLLSGVGGGVSVPSQSAASQRSGKTQQTLYPPVSLQPSHAGRWSQGQEQRGTTIQISTALEQAAPQQSLYPPVDAAAMLSASAQVFVPGQSMSGWDGGKESLGMVSSGTVYQ
eukprot:TRINITY_DN6398_c0_g2_i1.p1 TRINITY_DN6398_c0_g2~~TRINITY_DN6398_c0_g2_i1.p1  ORF type:complete len:407 (+),score=87.37 TRINITY_DN6398_c0_g2_i1:34-1254(+)